MTVDHFTRHSGLNPVPEVGALPDSASTSVALLDAVDRRASVEPAMNNQFAPGRRWKGPLVAVAAMAVVLVIGVVTLLTTSSAPDSSGEPEPAPVTSPELLGELSGAAGTLDTPLGLLSWVHASGGPGLPSGTDNVIETPEGLVAVVATVDSQGRPTSGWVTSADGVDWTVEAFPVPVEGAAAIGGSAGSYWLKTDAGVWLSEDAGTWVQVDLSAFAPPLSSGLIWDAVVDSVAIAGDTTLVSWRAQAAPPYAEIFGIPEDRFPGGVIASNCTWYWEPPCTSSDALDEYVVLGIGVDEDDYSVLGHVRLEAEGDTASILDANTGRSMHEVALVGLSGQEIITALTSDNLVWQVLGVVGADSLTTVVDPPWASVGIARAQVVGIDDRFLAYVDTSDPHGPTLPTDVEVWESVDGVAWSSRGTLEAAGESGDAVHVELHLNRRSLFAEVEYDLDRELPQSRWLRSTNGLDWVAVPQDGPQGYVEPVGDGFVAVDAEVWLSADGVSWEQLAIVDQTPRSAILVGDMLIVSYEIEGVHETWAFDLGA